MFRFKYIPKFVVLLILFLFNIICINNIIIIILLTFIIKLDKKKSVQITSNSIQLTTIKVYYSLLVFILSSMINVLTELC